MSFCIFHPPLPRYVSSWLAVRCTAWPSPWPTLRPTLRQILATVGPMEDMEDSVGQVKVTYPVDVSQSWRNWLIFSNKGISKGISPVIPSKMVRAEKVSNKAP